MDLKTTYLGFELEHPLAPSASPLTGDVDMLKILEDNGASLVVLHSLFEEQIEHHQKLSEHFINLGTECFAESLTYFPPLEELDHGTEEYLDLVRRAKEALSIPVVASLNGSHSGDWTHTARLIESAGADALELNIYYLAMDMEETGEAVERRYLDTLKAVKSEVGLPVTVKLSPFFSSPSHMAHRLVEGGANGLSLFNRFYQPDILIEELEHYPHLELSDSRDLRLTLRWLAVLYGRIACPLAATSGIHTVEDVVKAVMAGASVAHLCSALLKNGPGHINSLKKQLLEWMESHEYESLGQMRGCMSRMNCPNPAALERANYMRTLYSW
ncbi:MAG: dihydroorotate dehydrogenase [Nitrospinae bacterium CG11_big_fil_rev_8_21_14_0_20_56_8]|nr:MAG: dihydroorotate dehydrogenase [Nitrospinae bacterium CG11_big_fil_rev_8_21_14_0_20_56_8]